MPSTSTLKPKSGFAPHAPHHHVGHANSSNSAPDKLTVRQIGILFLSVAAFGIAIAAYAGSEHDKEVGRVLAEPTALADEQAGRLLLRP